MNVVIRHEVDKESEKVKLLVIYLSTSAKDAVYSMVN